MIESHNVLVIESLSWEQENGRFVSQVYAMVNASIEYRCLVTGNVFKSRLIFSQGRAYSVNEALKKAIQNLLNGEFSYEDRMYNVTTERCTSAKIHALDIRVPEPFKALFQHLFTLHPTFPANLLLKQ